MVLLLLLLMTEEVKVGDRGLSIVLVVATSGLLPNGMLLERVSDVLVVERGVRLGGTTPWLLLLMLLALLALCCSTARVVVFTSSPSTMVRVTLDGDAAAPLGGVVADLSLERGT